MFVKALAVSLGWALVGFMLAICLMGVQDSKNEVVVQFNNYGEMWMDVACLSLAFGLLTYTLLDTLKGAK